MRITRMHYNCVVFTASQCFTGMFSMGAYDKLRKGSSEDMEESWNRNLCRIS